jgi:hypothetical protein
LGAVKSKALKQGLVDEARRGLYDDAWPKQVLQINNAITNQFQLPMLFFVMILVLWLLNSITVWAHIFSWLFVVSRIVHAYIHSGSNDTPLRRNSFMVSCLFLLLITGHCLMSIFSSL